MTQLDGRRLHRRLLAAAAATTAVTLVAGGTGVAEAASAPPALSIVAATKNVIGVRYVHGDFVDFYMDLGVNLIAGKNPIEIRAHRKSYSTPIVAEQVVVKGGKKTYVRLPAGMVTDFRGLKNFTTITIKDKAGKTVEHYSTDYCLNSGSTRARRDAPAHSPYPAGCSGFYGYYNPFILGAVWGLQAGWAAPIAAQSYSGEDGRPQPDLDLPEGNYAVTVRVNPAYQKFFAIPAQSATTELNLAVQTVIEPDDEGDGPGKGKALASLRGRRLDAQPRHSRRRGQGERTDLRLPAGVPAAGEAAGRREGRAEDRAPARPAVAARVGDLARPRRQRG